MKNEFSLNDWFVCELTPHGRALLVEHYRKNPIGNMDEERSADRYKRHDGKYEFQLWEFAYIFGKDLWNGAENVTEKSKFVILRAVYG